MDDRTQLPELRTRRLLLRPFTEADAPEVQRLAGHAAIADTTLNIPHPYPDGAAEAWITTHQERFREGEGVTFAVTRRGDGALIGSIGLSIHARFERAELGYWIGKAYWERGYCTEAAREAVKYGFQMLGLHKITSRHFSRNPASGRVMQKIGMRREGHLRGHVKKGEAFEDVELYGILRGDCEPADSVCPDDGAQR